MHIAAPSTPQESPTTAMSEPRTQRLKASPYITAAGYHRLQDELHQLWRRRAEVTQALAAAAAEGDRSENAEYIYRKKELRELDRRIRYLNKRLPSLTVVERTPTRTDQVFFGAWVTLEDPLGTATTYRIVGADETAGAPGWISVDAPLARALLRKSLDEEVSVVTPSGRLRYLIVEVSYQPP